jgi:hypothetical protein
MNMMARCYSEKDFGYCNYGGRGIGVEEFLQDVSNYIAYVSLLPDYAPGMELDRMDNEGQYKRGNLRWVTHSKNNSNTRRNLPFVAWHPLRQILHSHSVKSEFAARYGVDPSSITKAIRSQGRLIVKGWHFFTPDDFESAYGPLAGYEVLPMAS